MTKSKLLSLQPVSTSSLEIADLLGVRHDSVKRTIERLAKLETITLPPLVKTSFKDKIGKKQKTTVYTFSGDSDMWDCFTVIVERRLESEKEERGLSPDETLRDYLPKEVLDAVSHLKRIMSGMTNTGTES